MRNLLKATAVLIMVFSLSAPAFSWYDHFLYVHIMQNELSQYHPVLNERIEPVAFETFLARNTEPLRRAFRDFYSFKQQVYKHDQWRLTADNYEYLFNDKMKPMTPDRFRNLAGINKTAFTQIEATDFFKKLYPGFNNTRPGSMRFVEWLALFSDEPDWGMDQFLFGQGDPRFTEIPYGNEDDLSSQAAFHMFFGNESFVTYKLQPSLKESMTKLRFTLFMDLAITSLRQRELFWAARFMGNSLHYLQDIAQPYHSSALPFIGFRTYLEFATERDRDQFLADNMQLMANRHFIYEEAVSHLIQVLINEPEKFTPNLNDYVLKGVKKARGSHGIIPRAYLNDLFLRHTKDAHSRSKELDSLLGEELPNRLVNDPTYNRDEDQSFNIETVFPPAVIENYLGGNISGPGMIFEHYRQDFADTVIITGAFITHLIDSMSLMTPNTPPPSEKDVVDAIANADRLSNTRRKMPFFWPWRPSTAKVASARHEASKLSATYILSRQSSPALQNLARRTLSNNRSLRTAIFNLENTSFMNPIARLNAQRELKAAKSQLDSQQSFITKLAKSLIENDTKALTQIVEHTTQKLQEAKHKLQKNRAQIERTTESEQIHQLQHESALLRQKINELDYQLETIKSLDSSIDSLAYSLQHVTGQIKCNDHSPAYNAKELNNISLEQVQRDYQAAYNKYMSMLADPSTDNSDLREVSDEMSRLRHLRSLIMNQ